MGVKWTRQSPRQRVILVHALALVLAVALFYVHSIVLFDVAGLLLEHRAGLEDSVGFHQAGKLIVSGCFLILFAAHIAEAMLWALFLRWRNLVSGFAEGLYFTTVTMTTLGYGDVTLPPPWRQLGPLLAIAGVLTFGCSTAFLFVVMQGVWALHL
jgi:voltage-gated potassium channel Kch